MGSVYCSGRPSALTVISSASEAVSTQPTCSMPPARSSVAANCPAPPSTMLQPSHRWLVFWSMAAEGHSDYGIQAKGVDGLEEPFDRVEDLAAFYLRSLSEIQPHGPYLLVGYCFEGLVALEMAHSLLPGESRRSVGQVSSRVRSRDRARRPSRHAHGRHKKSRRRAHSLRERSAPKNKAGPEVHTLSVLRWRCLAGSAKPAAEIGSVPRHRRSR